MNFLLDPKLRQLLIDQLDADGHYELATKLEQLPAIIPQTQYEPTNCHGCQPT